MKIGDYAQPLSGVVQNILDEPIPERVRRRLLKPLKPFKGGKPVALPREKKVTRRQAILQEFDPYPLNGSQTITNYQNELLRLYDALDGVVGEEWPRFMRWTFSKRLEQNLTPSIMGKLRERVNAAFYIRYFYSDIIVNIKVGRRNGFL